MTDYVSEHKVYIGEWSAHKPHILSSNTDLFLFLLNNPYGLTDEGQLRNQVELLATGKNLSPELRLKKSKILRERSVSKAEEDSIRYELEENDREALEQIYSGATQSLLLEKNTAYSAAITQIDPTSQEDRTVYRSIGEPQEDIHASFRVWFALTKEFNQVSMFEDGTQIRRSQSLLFKRSAILLFPDQQYILYLQPIHLVTRQLLLHQFRE